MGEPAIDDVIVKVEVAADDRDNVGRGHVFAYCVDVIEGELERCVYVVDWQYHELFPRQVKGAVKQHVHMLGKFLILDECLQPVESEF